MVLLTITPFILEALRYLDQAGTNVENRQPTTEFACQEPSLVDPSLGDPISHGQIIDLSRKCREINESRNVAVTEESVSYKLEHLLRGSRVYIRPSKAKMEPVSQADVRLKLSNNVSDI